MVAPPVRQTGLLDNQLLDNQQGLDYLGGLGMAVERARAATQTMNALRYIALACCLLAQCARVSAQALEDGGAPDFADPQEPATEEPAPEQDPQVPAPKLEVEARPLQSPSAPVETPAKHSQDFSARARVQAQTSEERATAASDMRIELGALRDVPRRNAEQYLTLAPGVVLLNHAGIGHASSVMLRGFDAGEGQDFEVVVDGVPLNEPSNAHGHGYADTHFLIPELVKSVRVVEGPFDPRQSDFAIAGSSYYTLGVQERGVRGQLGYGRFAERRALLLWAPTGASEGTFGAVDVRDGHGFGPNRAHNSVRALARYEEDVGPLQYSVLAASHALRFDSAGVVRTDAIDERTLPCAPERDSQRFCLHDPNQGGAAARHLVTGELSWHRPQRRAHLRVFGMERRLRMRENYSGVLLDDRGDGLDQRYEITTLGAQAGFVLTPSTHNRGQNRTHRLDLGVSARRDVGRTRLWRLRRGSGIPHSSVFDVELDLTHIGAHARGELSLAPWFSVLGGVRLDAFGFSTLALDEATSDRVGERLPVNARDAWGTALSPRGTLLVRPWPFFDWSVSAGLGVRSSDAQALSEGEAAPFARALALETGPSSTLQLSPAVALQTRAFVFATRVTDDLVFDAERGRNVPVGRSDRYGGSTSARLLIGGADSGTASDTLLSFTWMEAHLPPESAGAFELGSGPRLPFVPRVVARADQALRSQVSIARERVALGAALGMSLLGPRPLPLGAHSDTFAQLDASLRARVRFLELALSVENLLDTHNHAFELHHASDFGDPLDAEPASMRAVRHVAAAPPRLWMLTLTFYLDDAVLVPGSDP